MTVDQQKMEIEQLLQELDDGDVSLRKTHTNVLISFEQMLGYIGKIMEPSPLNKGARKPAMQKDIEFLLKTYEEMSQRYYTQFELSLLRTIKERHDTAGLSKKAIQLIDLKDPGDEMGIKAMERTRKLLDDDCLAAVDAHRELIKNFPALMQDALDKLRDEWQRLGTIAVASQALAKDRKLIRSLEAVVEVAAASIGIEAQRIVVVPGKEFALYFFTYLKNFVVFTVPIYSVQAPWEWSIFWHELAGHRVRSLERGATAIDEIRTNLQKFHKAYNEKTTAEEKSQLLNDALLGNQAGVAYLKEVLIGKEPLDPIDLGGFDHQFERMMLKLLRTNRFKLYESMKQKGWCVDWFKELFEDAWSVLAIRQPFLIFLHDILSRKNSVDGRHPLPDIRLGVAIELLKKSYPSEEANLGPDVVLPQPTLTLEEKSIVEIVTGQLIRFLSLIICASHKSAVPTALVSEDIQQKRLFENVSEANVRAITERVTHTIQDAILEWSEDLHTAADPVRQSQECAKKYISAFSSEEFIKRRGKRQSPEPSYEKLLTDEQQKDRSYEELLALSFYDTDFGVSSVANVFYRSTRKFDTARLNSVPEPVTHGEVTYESGGVQSKTSIDFWNTAAVSGFKI